ncbi:uncharacterized protein LOC117905154 [Vitis riparia]|uniref:Uncharacterized protein n=1 Tax=Vitis vinifera TaxID=29760 RepID=F6HTB5_VITVI|nr:uncharacterized protein LOC100267676 [Vitis vinifera]XP_034673965.1 uncharacterized protein LOC117905154 [Vitis riparia]|eukprot:XP_002281373.1 PREDICTED: uncharacterized protein LOC100267676 [Vitis vinifera]
MDCLVLPVSIWKRRSASRLGYRELSDEGLEEAVTVVVGKEEREFLVEPFVLEESPFRVLLEMVRKENKEKMGGRGEKEKKEKRVIYVDVDSILFEHMLWLMYNDCSSLFQLNLREIIDFYAQDN